MPKLGVRIDVPPLVIQANLFDNGLSREEHEGGLPPAPLIKRSIFSFKMLFRQRSSRRAVVRCPPGSRLNAIGEFVFSRKTYERVIQPTISDIQDEYMAALAQKRTWKARWIWFRGHYSFWAAFVAQVPVSAMKLVVKIWKAAGN